MKKYLIGVDVGGTSIKFGRFSLEGDLIEKWNIRTNHKDQGEYIITDIVKSLESQVEISEISGIGIGVPGPVKDDLIIHCVNLNWGTKNIKEEMKSLLQREDIIIKIGNDANVAAAGEMYKGSAKGYKNVVMYTLGTGIGGGIIIDGRPLEGVNGAGAELGHIVVDFKHNYRCACGKTGCLETVSSATGIVRLAKEYLIHFKARSPLRHFENFSAKKVFDYAKEGDYISRKIIEESMKYLALAIANVSLTIDPEIIIIGGGVSNAGGYLIDMINKFYPSFSSPFIKKANIQLATLGNDAGIYGCAYLVK